MLNAHRIPRACHSCRLELLSIFTNGLASPPISKSFRPRATILRPRNPQSIQINAARNFSTTRLRREQTKENVPSITIPSSAAVEDVVRQARQTFGETLPKDYLSTEEYALYERLYGPPLRETKADDLEYLPEWEEVADEKVRNVLLRINDQGEYEEVEFDPSLGFTVTNTEADLEAAAGFVGEGEEVIGEYIPGAEDVLETEDAYLEDELAEAHEAVALKQPDTVQVMGQNQREIDAIARLQKDMDAAMARPVEEEEDDIDEEFEEDDEEVDEDEFPEEEEQDGYVTSDTVRTHPHTMAARSGTFPSTLSLPKDKMIDPVTELLERTNMKHLTEAAERAFGGKGIPNSPSTRSVKGPTPQKHIGLDALQHKMTELEADTFLAASMPQTYAPVMSTLVEVRKRLGGNWIRDLLFKEGGEGPRFLDAGAGGAAAIAWREVLQAEWDVLREEGIVEGEQAPMGKTTVLTGSTTLRHRVSRFLDDTTFLPRLPDYIHSRRSEQLLDGAPAQERKSFDIIVAPHTLFGLKEEFRRKNMIQNLWSLLDPNGGVLILIEKGIPRGFEAIAGARALLLDSHISSPGETPQEDEIQSPSDKRRFKAKEEGMIIAPCTNHKTCPMYTIPGLSSGRKDFCHFNQRFIRPGYLQRVLGASIRNHEDVKYSYIAVRRGVDARKNIENPVLQGDTATDQAFEGYEDHDLPEFDEPGKAESDVKFNSLSLPRIILSSLKRRGHVTMDLCTPSGQLERWTIPKSFSKAAHRDARKSKWGDLWALGAKTRVGRSPRLGMLGGGADSKSKTGLKGIRDGRIGKGGKKAFKVNKFEIVPGADGMADVKPTRSKYVQHEKRTKGGRVYKEPKPVNEDGF